MEVVEEVWFPHHCWCYSLLTYLAQRVSKVTPSHPRNPHLHCCCGPQEGLSGTFQKVDGPTHSGSWASISVNCRDRPAYLISQAPIQNYIAKVQNLADHYQLLFLFQRNSWVFLLAVIVCCSVSKPFRTLCDPMDCSMPGFPVLHYLPELAQTQVHWVGDATQPSHPLLPPSPPITVGTCHYTVIQTHRMCNTKSKP